MSGQMEIESITKSYGMGSLRKPVIEDCSFTLEEGKLTVLIGPSGCGKTTLINVLAGYDAVESGTISIDGSPVKGPEGPTGCISGDSAFSLDDHSTECYLRSYG